MTKVQKVNETARFPEESAPKLVVEQLPKETVYAAGDEISYEGLQVTFNGQDVTKACYLSVPEGTVWKKDWKKLEVTVSHSLYEPVTFELRHKRKIWPIIVILVGLLLVLLAGLSMCMRVAPQDLVVIMADTVGITQNNKDTHANIEGTTSFQSPRTPDTKWVAGSTSQHFVMANPDGNTVALAPHIYVDFDANGEFSEDECIFNKITYGRNGEVTSYGEFIDVGRQLEDIEIDRPIDAGEYKAKVLYTAVDKESKTLCNGNEFVFDLTVS